MTTAHADTRRYQRTQAALVADVTAADMAAVLMNAFGCDDAWGEATAIQALIAAGFRELAIFRHFDAAREIMNANRRRMGWQEI